MISTLHRLSTRVLIFTFTLLELPIREVASCTFYNVNSRSFDHWSCPRHTVCCIYYNEKSCCREQEAYMNSGKGGSAGNVTEPDWGEEVTKFFKENYSQVMIVLSAIIVFILIALCLIQCRKRMEEEEEAEELFRINQMIQMSEEGSTSPSNQSLYRPQPLCPLRHGEDTPSELTTITAQQPPSYDSIAKGTQPGPSNEDISPPPPYAP